MIKIMEKKPEKIADYQNGNVHIELYEDGTRIMESEDDEFVFDMPTNCDITITHSCTGNCPYCYLGCTENGEIADLNDPVLDTLAEYQELAINLNDLNLNLWMELLPFLRRMKEQKVFVNGTINQIHFMEHYDRLKFLCDEHLLWGLGVSLRNPDKEFIEKAKTFPNLVIHVINGLFGPFDIEMLRDHDLKILILGYKNLGRGTDYLEKNEMKVKATQRYLKDVLPTLFNHFKVVSFDNLAIEQLGVKDLLTQKEWDEIYQGDEGTSTFYLDLVTKKFGISSLASEDEMMPMLDNIRDMFQIVRSKAKQLSTV